MEIKTKYDIGQTVWFCLFETPAQGKIREILVRPEGVSYQMDNTDRPVGEDYIGTTKDECDIHCLESDIRYCQDRIDGDRREIEEIKGRINHES